MAIRVYDERSRRSLEGDGFIGAFLAEFPWSQLENRDLFRLNRIPVDPTLGVFGIAFAVGRGYDLWAWVKARMAHRTGRARLPVIE